MERRKFLTTAGSAGLAGIIASGMAPAVHGQNKQIKWRLASSFPKALDTIYGGAEDFANIVKDMSGGRLTIDVHAGGELVPPFGVVDAVKDGTIDCAHTASYYFFGKDPTFALDCAVPFGLNSRQMTAWMYQGNGLTLFREFFANYGIVNFPCGNSGTQMGGWYRKPLKSLADIKGLKMRIGGFSGTILASLGGTPQNIPGGEIYGALEKGVIDAVEWIGPYDDQKLGFYRVCKNYVYPAWWEGGPQLTLYVGKKAFDSLDSDLKAIVSAAASHSHIKMQAKYDAWNPKALRELVAQGTVLQQMPKDIMDAAWAASQDKYNDLSKTNPAWKKIYSDYAAFRKDQVQWFGIAEFSYDSFMQTVKL